MKTFTTKQLYNSGFKQAYRHFPEMKFDAVRILETTHLNSLDKIFIFKKMNLVSDKLLRQFAILCANKVSHLITDARCLDALECAKRYVNGTATKTELIRARRSSKDIFPIENRRNIPFDISKEIEAVKYLAHEVASVTCSTSAHCSADVAVYYCLHALSINYAIYAYNKINRESVFAFARKQRQRSVSIEISEDLKKVITNGIKTKDVH